MNEKELDTAVGELAALFGWLRYHTFDSHRSPCGFPDLVLVRPPRLIAAELKAENGRLTASQTEWLDALGRCPGIETYVWRPQDLDHVASMLSRNWGKGQPFELEERCLEAIDRELEQPVDMFGCLHDHPDSQGSIWLFGVFIRLISTKRIGKRHPKT